MNFQAVAQSQQFVIHQSFKLRLREVGRALDAALDQPGINGVGARDRELLNPRQADFAAEVFGVGILRCRRDEQGIIGRQNVAEEKRGLLSRKRVMRFIHDGADAITGFAQTAQQFIERKPSFGFGARPLLLGIGGGHRLPRRYEHIGGVRGIELAIQFQIAGAQCGEMAPNRALRLLDQTGKRSEPKPHDIIERAHLNRDMTGDHCFAAARRGLNQNGAILRSDGAARGLALALVQQIFGVGKNRNGALHRLLLIGFQFHEGEKLFGAARFGAEAFDEGLRNWVKADVVVLGRELASQLDLPTVKRDFAFESWQRVFQPFARSGVERRQINQPTARRFETLGRWTIFERAHGGRVYQLQSEPDLFVFDAAHDFLDGNAARAGIEEIAAQTGNATADGFASLRFGEGVTFDGRAQTLVRDVAAHVFVGLFCGGFGRGNQNKTAVAFVLEITLQNRVPRRAASGEAVENNILRPRRLLDQTLHQRKRLGIGEIFVAQHLLQQRSALRGVTHAQSFDAVEFELRHVFGLHRGGDEPSGKRFFRATQFAQMFFITWLTVADGFADPKFELIVPKLYVFGIVGIA